MFAKRTNFPSTIRDALIQSHKLEMERLQSRWERRLEAEAKECEHPERIETLRSQMPLGDSSATNRIQEASENVSADKIRREAIIKKVQNSQTNTILSVREAALYFEVVPALFIDEGNWSASFQRVRKSW